MAWQLHPTWPLLNCKKTIVLPTECCERLLLFSFSFAKLFYWMIEVILQCILLVNCCPIWMNLLRIFQLLKLGEGKWLGKGQALANSTSAMPLTKCGFIFYLFFENNFLRVMCILITRHPSFRERALPLWKWDGK